jgi:RNA polymerase sigma-70 factor (ECF subfamily)
MSTSHGEGEPTDGGAMEWDSDEQLLRRWREGETGAAAILIDRHSAMLRGFFGRRGLDAAADDLVQQTVLACLERIDHFPGEASFGSRLFGMARNQLRAHRRLVKRNEDLASPAQEGFDDVASPPPSSSSAKSDSTKEAVLAGAMQRLPPDLRTVLELSYWRGLGRNEIATSLRLPAGTVASRMRRAKEKLREMMRASAQDDESAPDSR